MNFAVLIGLVPTIIRVVDFMKRAVSQGLSVNTISSLFANEDVKKIFAELGAQLFPKLREELQPSAAAVVSYAPDYVMKVQNAVNVLMTPTPPLDVDGLYGKATRAAVEQLQHKMGLDEVDGWAGDKTMAAIQAALLKKPDEVKASIPAPEIPKPPLAPAPV